MDINKNITYFPENLTKYSLVTINYFGTLNTSEKLYIEYYYNENSTVNNSIRKVEMSKNPDCSSALVSLEYAGTLYFRFIDENGNFDDNNGEFYKKNVEESSSDNLLSMLSEYEKVENNSQNPFSEDIDNKFESTNMALVPIKEQCLARKGLRFSYKLNKRIKLLLIKLFRKLPSFITGNYRRRINL